MFAPQSPKLSYEFPEAVASPGLTQNSTIQAVVLTLSVTFLLCIAYLDYITPLTISFAYYYAIGALTVTWWMGRRMGLGMVGITIGLWTSVEITDFPNKMWYVPWVNAATRAVALILAVLMLYNLQLLSRHLGLLVQERTRSLRQLATRLAEAEDSERRRLAHDLHDGLIQMLSVLKLNLAAAVSEEGQGTSVRQRLHDATGVVDDLIHKSRTLTFDLHPAMLDHLGLVSTLRRFADEFSQQTQLDITINEEGSPSPISAVIARHLFRSTKELMSNAAKHASARQVVVSVYWKGESLRLIVDDDGSGFEPVLAQAPDLTRGLGLPSINERLLSLGGSMSIESNIGAGARVVLEVPLTGGAVSAGEPVASLA